MLGSEEVLQKLLTDGLPITIPPVTVDTTGLATDANQTNGSQKTKIVDAAGTHTMPAGDAATRPVFVELADGTNPLGTSGNPMRSDPTGTTTQPVSATALPLPTGAATAANQSTANTSLSSINTKQSDGSQKTQIVDSAGTHVMPAGDAAGRPVFVEISDGTNPLGTSGNPMRSDPTGTTTQPVSATALPLPTGAATAANQSTANTSLSSINTKQSDGSQKTQIVDSAGTHTMPAGDAAARPVFVELSDGSAALGTSGNPIRTSPTQIQGAATEATLDKLRPRGALTSASAGASNIFVISVPTSSTATDLSGANYTNLASAIAAGKMLKLKADGDVYYRWGTATGTVDETKTAADTPLNQAEHLFAGEREDVIAPTTATWLMVKTTLPAATFLRITISE